MKDVPDIGEQFADANDEVDFHDPNGNGWTLVTLTADDVRADFRKVTDVRAETFTASDVTAYVSRRTEDGMTPLEQA